MSEKVPLKHPARVSRDSVEEDEVSTRGSSARRLDRVTPFPALGLLASLLLMPVLTGCPGSLGSGFVPIGSPPGPGTGGSGMTGTGGTGMTGTGGSGNVGPACDAPTMVLATSCALTGCHLGVFPPNLTTVDVATLKTTSALFSTGPCTGKPLLNAADPAGSPLLLRATGTTCGERMPYLPQRPDLAYLSQPLLDCLTSWVMANAK